MRSFWVVMRNTLLIEMEYRISYFILVFSNFVSLAMEYAVMSQIFLGRDKVGTLTRDNLVPFIVLGTIVRSASSLWALIQDSVDTIREGSFQKFLMQPVHYPSYFFAQALGGKGITFLVLMSIALILKFFFGFPDFLSTALLPQFLVAMAFSIFVTWQIYLFMVYLGFWIEEASFMGTAFNISVGIFSGTMIPLDWLPPVLLKVIRFTPYPLIGDFPMRAGLGSLSPGEFGSYATLGICWILGLGLANALFWNWGTKRYEAFGG